MTQQVAALKQEANCVDHRTAHPEVHKTHGHIITDCGACAQGDTIAELRQKINRQKFMEIERLLFAGQKKVTIYDTGENWNQRFQKIIVLPEDTQLERSAKYIALDTLNKDCKCPVGMSTSHCVHFCRIHGLCSADTSLSHSHMCCYIHDVIGICYSRVYSHDICQNHYFGIFLACQRQRDRVQKYGRYCGRAGQI